MVILHIASVEHAQYSGVSTIVPQHVRAQMQFAEVGFLNVAVGGPYVCQQQFQYTKGLLLSDLPTPFCKPDLIVFHEVYRPAFLKLCRQAKMMAVPYIIVPHGCLTKVAQRKKRMKKLVANLLLFNAFIEGARAIQFLSEAECRNSDFGRNKIVEPNGVFMPKERKTGFHSDIIKLLYIGRTEIQIKGLDLMVQAIALIANHLRENHAKLFMYGPDYKTQHSDIRSLIRQYNVEDLVELGDAIGGEEKKKELLSADLFLQTSRTEGLPVGILEALSYGLPCLVTTGTNLGEIVSEYDAGWTAQTDAQSVANAILKAIDERNTWSRKSENGIRLIAENFDWPMVARNTVAQYRRIMDGTF